MTHFSHGQFMHLFIYYKFPPGDFPEIESQARQLIGEVQAAIPGVHVQLLKRPEASDSGEQTWMEAYWCEADQFEALKDCVLTTAARLKLPTQRRLEVFVPV